LPEGVLYRAWLRVVATSSNETSNKIEVFNRGIAVKYGFGGSFASPNLINKAFGLFRVKNTVAIQGINWPPSGPDQALVKEGIASGSIIGKPGANRL
jgi:hypothetical protein